MNSAGGIAAVVVTRNRLSLLKQCLEAVRRQSRPTDATFVVDNASDDGTADWLSKQQGLEVIRQGNLGGAGGFYEGIRQAYEKGHRWIWCMDDDTIPEPNCLLEMCETSVFQLPDTGYLSSLVKWKDGTLHRMNLPTISAHSDWIDQVLGRRTIPTLSSSFVSLLVSRQAVRECGLPIKEMFIWGDDTEYTRRISRRFNCYTCLESVALHATSDNAADSLSALGPTTRWKFQYGYRNNAYLLATGEGALWQKAALIFRRLRATLREVIQLRKLAYFPMLVGAVFRGAFAFRPTIVFAAEKSAANRRTDGPP